MRSTSTTSTILLALTRCRRAPLRSPQQRACGRAAGGASAPCERARRAPAKQPAVHPTGIATWFGPGFYGQKTACGQTLTPAVVGVANRTLPCGTLVRVSYSGHALTCPCSTAAPTATSPTGT